MTGKSEKSEKSPKRNGGKHGDKRAGRDATVDGQISAVSATASITWKEGENVVAILGARLIDGTGSDPLDNAGIIIKGGRIVKVGRRKDIVAPRGATVIEADGRTIIPGLIDCHVHLT